ncbi:hypothetical protein IT882_13225 [Microbacterium schleiferi]|uniref:Uncharacterized protein n=1 Tax=Microbacterium schleiferi TaxID=69362 RepID=A0A7S8MWT1_9MICO|nr:hypothetical protein [Microbacterium schleiferi]QPE04153.1 hypothetical protein IT882_13225 [Microbacterium schleiferi]
MNIFDTFKEDSRWIGFGYIAGRDNLSPENRAAADGMVLALGLPEVVLFEWANSREGRWYADAWEDGDSRGFAADYLPNPANY